MNPRPPAPPTPSRPKQTVAQELRDDLLRLLWQKFYRDDPAGSMAASKAFAQDRARLLAWVILFLARFITRKGFTVTADRYKKIVTDIILDAIRHGNTTRLGYRPAWLKMVIENHFAKHWEEYYDAAKAVGFQAEHTILMLGKLPVAPAQAVDPVRQLAEAAALLTKAFKPASVKPSGKDQLTLL